MFHKQTRNWVQELPLAVKTMNSRTHSATGLPPNEVTIDNAGQVFKRLYPMLSRNKQPSTGLKPKFRIGQFVRILLPSTLFQKGDLAKATDEVYKVARILFHPVIRYKLIATNGNLISGSYDQTELIPVEIPQEP